MKAHKDPELEKCHSDFLAICFEDFPMNRVSERVSNEITGYVTNINEKIQSYSDFLALLKMQRQESATIAMKFDFQNNSKTVFAGGNAAIYNDEAVIPMKIEGKTLDLFLRISTAFELNKGKWKALHFHGSFPQGEEGEPDTWTVNEWKQKNEELEKIIKKKSKDLNESLEHLKATQAQLIQLEKMAGLGQLTAGIAHEIKNPLNFVNNFSEVSKELIEEMQEELKNGNYELVKEITNDVVQNLEKIHYHGKRADDIVKGMLLHSRSNTGKKEDITVNSFIDEYLRLAYHGLRAKDKSFNARLETCFDEKAGKIRGVPQELGRVVLNLLTNAFYAVNEKKQEAGEEFEPTVKIETRVEEGFLKIKISDNGKGISEEIKDKIFQPFFTTKPTGLGTGLGLSLSYDIIKAHGGEIEVASQEGRGTCFCISLVKD